MNIDLSAVMAVSGTAAALIWIILYTVSSGKYRDVSGTEAARSLKFTGILPTGFELMKILDIDIRRRKYCRKRSSISEIYGERYAGYYTYLFTGAQISYTAFLIPVSLLAGAAADSGILCAAGLAVSVLMLFVIDAEIKKKTAEKHDAVICELPDAIMRLTLLINAGMVLREAWTLVAESSDSVLGAEMMQTGSDIRNGIPEQDAFNTFAERCRTKEIRKFTGSLVQNLKKGNSGLAESLMILAEELREEKKNYVRKKAAAVEQNLLFPMIMIFTAVILMIIVPVFADMF